MVGKDGYCLHPMYRPVVKTTASSLGPMLARKWWPSVNTRLVEMGEDILIGKNLVKKRSRGTGRAQIKMVVWLLQFHPDLFKLPCPGMNAGWWNITSINASKSMVQGVASPSIFSQRRRGSYFSDKFKLIKKPE